MDTTTPWPTCPRCTGSGLIDTGQPTGFTACASVWMTCPACYGDGYDSSGALAELDARIAAEDAALAEREAA